MNTQGFHLLAAVWILIMPLVAAQFNFFDMFGHQHQHQPQQEPPLATQWMAQADAVSCNAYLCPDSLVCVPYPADCPCLSPEDVKCLLRDPKDKNAATVVCTRGQDGCAEVERLAKRWT